MVLRNDEEYVSRFHPRPGIESPGFDRGVNARAVNRDGGDTHRHLRMRQAVGNCSLGFLSIDPGKLLITVDHHLGCIDSFEMKLRGIPALTIGHRRRRKGILPAVMIPIIYMLTHDD